MSDSSSQTTQAAITPVPVSEPCRLADTMAGLLATAIADARSLDPDTYMPFCLNWHDVNSLNVCEVCLAGSVIAVSLKNSPTMTITPESFSPNTENKLRAIDSMRGGNWLLAFGFVYGQCPEEIADRLRILPKPKHADFIGWDRLHAHLDSLESILPELRQVDELAAQLS